jgi:hypothetical protein
VESGKLRGNEKLRAMTLEIVNPAIMVVRSAQQGVVTNVG